MRCFLVFAVLFALLPAVARAVEAPVAQTRIDAAQILRGNFVQEHRGGDGREGLQTSGHFTVAPAHGLIWSVEHPFPTATIVTPNGASQNIGGLFVKLPIRNLRHLYEVVGAALAGNWHALAPDFDMTRAEAGDNTAHWQMTLVPRADGNAKLSYDHITVTGSRFVEAIVLSKADGGSDRLNFTGTSVAPEPPLRAESAAFDRQVSIH